MGNTPKELTPDWRLDSQYWTAIYSEVPQERCKYREEREIRWNRKGPIGLKPPEGKRDAIHEKKEEGYNIMGGEISVRNKHQ